MNGMTGQFSLGHAAFMALGGYAAGMVTYYGSMLLWGSPAQARRLLGIRRMAVRRRLPRRRSRGDGRRLRRRPAVACDSSGDYLAIVTLGFGEILRVILQQTEPVIDMRPLLREAELSRDSGRRPWAAQSVSTAFRNTRICSGSTRS